MQTLILNVLTIAGLLGASAFVPALAERLRIPATVLLATMGVAIGALLLLAGHPGGDASLWPLASIISGLRSLPIPPDALLLIFLPVLLFETALGIDARALRDDVVPILTMAVVAVLVTTFVIGYTLDPFTPVGLVPCLLLGAIVATTDPVAVVGIFREVGAPRRLSDLVEGESLLNDAAAIALFTTFLAVITARGDLMQPAAADVAWQFLWKFLGGGLFGAILGRFGAALLTRLDAAGPAEITISLALAYLSYELGENALHVSGVVATVAAGLVFGNLGRGRVAAADWESFHGTWRLLGFWAASLVFVLAAMLIPRVLSNFQLADLGLLAILILASFAARILVLFGVLPLLARLKLSEPIASSYRVVMLWGGLRGAVTLALALAAGEHAGLSAQDKHLVEVLAVSYVLFTLFVQGTTLRPLIRWLKLDRLGPLERMVRDRALELTQTNLLDRMRTEAKRLGVDPNISKEMERLYKERLATPRRSIPMGDDMLREQLTAALVTLTRREAELYVEEIARGLVGRRTASNLLSDTERLQDALKTDGPLGYRSSAKRLDRFDRGTRIALRIQHLTGWEALLARRLSDRFEVLLIRRRVLSELVEFARERLPVLFEQRVAETARHVIEDRRETANLSFEAMRLQYPDYAVALSGRYLDRTELRMEQDAYQQMLDERLLTPQLHRSLMNGLRERGKAINAAPKLDLRLNVSALLGKLPLFDDLDPEQLDAMARLLRSRLALPGERIIRRGEVSERMFFIASGAVEVVLEQPVRLGTGDFFGEFGLLTNAPRLADVQALTYCQLLELRRDVFERFLQADPKAEQAIRRVAEERLGHPLAEVIGDAA